MDKLEHLRMQKYKEQAVWFLNACDAGNCQDMCELVWNMHKTCSELDGKGENGNVVDELTALRVLELSNEPCTIKELRNFLMEIHVSYNRRVSLIELLIFKFGYCWRDVVNAAQSCDWQAEKEAQERFDKAKVSLDSAIEAERKSMADAESARKAEENSLHEQEEAAKAAEASRVAEAAFSEAKNQSKIALESLNTQEKKMAKKKDDLERIAADDNLGIVKRNRAKAELAMLLSEDPLPLRAARIKQEAALRKLTKATETAGQAAAASEMAMNKAKEARTAAHAAKEIALAAAREAEARIPLARKALDEVQEVLENFSKNRRAGKGTIFYINRELKEAAKFLPRRKFLAAQREAADAIVAATPTMTEVCG